MSKTAVQEITPDHIETIRPILEAAMNDVCKKYGIKLKLGQFRISANGNSFTMKVNGNIVDKNGALKVNFTPPWGFHPSIVGATVTVNGENWRIVDAKQKNFIVERGGPGGKRLNYPIESMRQTLKDQGSSHIK